MVPYQQSWEIWSIWVSEVKLQFQRRGCRHFVADCRIFALVTLDLGDNDLSGDVPYLGNLTALNSVNLQGNNLTGEVEQMCFLNLGTLEADCHLVDCSCCTACSDPNSDVDSGTTLAPTLAPTVLTPPPTPLPTGMPTVKPTPLATECVSRLEWVSDCIFSGDTFEIRFTSCEPATGDWIGIFDKDVDVSNLPEPNLWVWSCGSQNCGDSPREGVVRFDSATVESKDSWPLADGDYIAYMVRSSGGPSVAFLATDKRKIKRDKCW